MRSFSLSSPVHLWQIRMALGVSLILTAGQVFGVPIGVMWMGFACASLLSEYPYSEHTTVRFRKRIVGAIVGSFAFLLLYRITPYVFHPFMGPLGGLCLGFCTDYQHKDAVILRIVDTILGVTFGLVFALLFHRLAAVKWLSHPEGKTCTEIK